MYAIFSKADGVQGFKILYWLSSCDDKDKDKDNKSKTKAKCFQDPMYAFLDALASLRSILFSE